MFAADHAAEFSPGGDGRIIGVPALGAIPPSLILRPNLPKSERMLRAKR